MRILTHKHAKREPLGIPFRYWLCGVLEAYTSQVSPLLSSSCTL